VRSGERFSVVAAFSSASTPAETVSPWLVGDSGGEDVDGKSSKRSLGAPGKLPSWRAGSACAGASVWIFSRRI
jgi:hypothetical protein